MEMDTVLPKVGISKRPSSSMIPGVGRVAAQRAAPNEQGYPITFKGLGKGGYELTLFCTTQIQREKWMKLILAQKEKLSERHKIFTMSKLNEGFFSSVRINCCRPIDGGRKLVIGTDYGVYVSDRMPKVASQKPKKFWRHDSLHRSKFWNSIRSSLCSRTRFVYSYSLDALDTDESIAGPSKKGRKICHANYYIRRHLQRPDPRVLRQIQLAQLHRQSLPTHGLHDKGQEEVRSRQNARVRTRSPQAPQGVLHPHGKQQHPLPALQTLRRRRQGLRDRLPRNSRNSIPARPGRHVARLRRSSRRAAVKTSTSSATRPSSCSATRFQFLRQQERLACARRLKILWEGAPNAFATWGEKYILAFENEFIEIRQSDTGGLVCIQTHKKYSLLALEFEGGKLPLF